MTTIEMLLWFDFKSFFDIFKPTDEVEYIRTDCCGLISKVSLTYLNQLEKIGCIYSRGCGLISKVSLTYLNQPKDFSFDCPLRCGLISKVSLTYLNQLL